MLRPYRRERERTVRAMVVRGLIVVLALGLAFVLGMAFARTLEDRPKPGGAGTTVRTLAPISQQAPTRTVTVTVTSP